MKLGVKSFGIACGVMWVFCVAWAIVLAMIGRGTAPFDFVNQFYLSLLAPTVGGLIMGIVIGFVDGLIAGAIFAWVYNLIAK